MAGAPDHDPAPAGHRSPANHRRPGDRGRPLPGPPGDPGHYPGRRGAHCRPQRQHLRSSQSHHRRPHDRGHGRQDRRHRGRRPLHRGGGVHHHRPDGDAAPVAAPRRPASGGPGGGAGGGGRGQGRHRPAGRRRASQGPGDEIPALCPPCAGHCGHRRAGPQRPPHPGPAVGPGGGHLLRRVCPAVCWAHHPSSGSGGGQIRPGPACIRRPAHLRRHGRHRNLCPVPR